MVSTASSGKFWSLDQQARLFPAQISDDSPWKQEAATSRLDKDTENRTQEALDLYFSRHHNVTTPEDVPLITASSLQNRSDIGKIDRCLLSFDPFYSTPILTYLGISAV